MAQTRQMQQKRKPGKKGKKKASPAGNAQNATKTKPQSTKTKKKAGEPMQSQLLEAAKAQLHTSCLPDVLLMRDDACAEIRKFIKASIKPPPTNKPALMAASSDSRVLYISGVPGTGKTASVLKVQKELKVEKPKFEFVNINALELSDPKNVFPTVYRAVNRGICGMRRKIKPKEAQQWLNDYFEEVKPRRMPIVILVDEVDMLYTKREEVLYTVFNWANIACSRCSVIAISNTLDLAERKFSPRIFSRMGQKRMIFQPYEHTEIEAILRHRIQSCPAISDKAIELASKKIASISGDLRKALELMRRAIDIVLEKCEDEEEQGINRQNARLETNHILDAIRECQTSIRMQFVRALSKHEELLFRALVKDLYESALEDTIFARVLQQYKQQCYGAQIEPLTLEAAFHHMCEMDDAHLVIMARRNRDGAVNRQVELRRQVQLGFPVSEAQFCIRQLDLARNNPHDDNAGGSASALTPSKSPSTTKSPTASVRSTPKSANKSSAAKSQSQSPLRKSPRLSTNGGATGGAGGAHSAQRIINFEEEAEE